MLIDRMIRAAKLDPQVFAEVEADNQATQQALMVIVIVALASGIGSGLGGPDLLLGLIGGVVTAVLGWLAWSFVTYLIGTKLFGGTTTWVEMLRVIGFANSPGVLHILRFIPVLGGLLSFAVAIWILIAGVIAVRQALGVTTGRAVATVIVGWLVYVVLAVFVGLLFAGFAGPGM